MTTSVVDDALHPMARLYQLWAFNFLVPVAEAVAADSVERPYQYRDLTGTLAETLAGFRSLLGRDPAWPDADQRKAMFRVLGPTCLAAAPLRDAALSYVKFASELNREVLNDAVVDAGRSFRQQLEGSDSAALADACGRIGALVDRAVDVVSSSVVTRAFDLPSLPREGWLLADGREAGGAVTVSELMRMLDAGSLARSAVNGDGRQINISMTRRKFALLQRCAVAGGAAINDALTDREATDPTVLIRNAYLWTKALQQLVPDIVRVWKDEAYRARLTDLEWGMVDPHPSGTFVGDLGEVMGPGLYFSTATVNGEICCCSGDLGNCTSNCQISVGVSCLNCGSIALAVARC